MFNFTSSLQQRSQSAIKSFTDTIKTLEDINNEIASETLKKQEKIAKLTSEVSSLEETSVTNKNIISKILNIIG